MLSINEGDRNFLDPLTRKLGPHRHLNLEAVAIGTYRGEIHCSQRSGLVDAKPCGGVVYPKAEHEFGVAISAPRQQVSVPGPVRN